MEKSNNLKHTIKATDIDGNDLYINIRLNDECKNGHQDFSITGYAYKVGKPKSDIYCLYGGACHDDIIKARPDLKPFVDLHLCDYSGAPMYAMGNGLYHLKEKPETGKEYLRLTDAEFNAVKDAEDELQLSCMLYDLGVIERWKEEAQRAIKTLEAWTGKEFLNDSIRSQYTPPTPEQIKDYKDKVNAGYYDPEQVAQRRADKIAAAKEKKRQSLIEQFNKKMSDLKNDHNVNLAVLDAMGTTDNFIYYTHSNEGVFNWQSGYQRNEITPEQFDEFLKNVNYANLPRGIKFSLKWTKKS